MKFIGCFETVKFWQKELLHHHRPQELLNYVSNDPDLLKKAINGDDGSHQKLKTEKRTLSSSSREGSIISLVFNGSWVVST